jgi:hypothetical protein
MGFLESSNAGSGLVAFSFFADLTADFISLTYKCEIFNFKPGYDTRSQNSEF